MAYPINEKFFKIGFFIIFFSWVSFLPEPIQGKFVIFIRIISFIFLVILATNKLYFRHLFTLGEWPLWLFIACLLAGLSQALDKKVATQTYLNLSVTLFLFYYLGKTLLFQEKKLDTFCMVICICSILVSLIGILEFIFAKNIIYENFVDNPNYLRFVKYQHRVISTQFNPAILGSYFLVCLPFNLYLSNNKQLYKKLLGLFSSLLCTVLILLTFSRGVLLGLFALLSFYFWKLGNRKLLIIFLLCAVTLLISSSLQNNHPISRFGFRGLIFGWGDSIISEYRWERIKMVFKILKDHPFLGIGFQHFRIRFNDYCLNNTAMQEIDEFRIPDNMYLALLAESGILGTSGFLIFLYLLLKNALRKIRFSSDHHARVKAIVNMSVLVGLCVNMGAYDLFYWNNPYLLFCLISGFIGLR